MVHKFSKRNGSISNTKMFSATMAWQLQCVLLVLLCAAESTYSVCTSLLKNNGNVAFTASSSSVGPGYPVLHGKDVWCAKFINGEQFLKVDLGSSFTFDQVFVQGMPGTHRSVFKYYVKTSITRRGFVQIEGEGGQKVFFGPYCDGDAVVGTNLTNPVQARWIVFNPQKPFFGNSPCMRIDIRSCQNTPPATSSTVQPTCNSLRPAVNGVWLSWGAWSACSETCGKGTRSRRRECTTPIPAGSEEACHGGEICTETCLIRRCPIPGNWSPWSDWSSCSETCGYGTKVRTRSCNNPAPAHGGATCQGDAINTDACFVRPCPTTSPPTTTLPQTTTSPSETTKTTTSPSETTKPPSTTPSQDTSTSSVQTTATSPPTTTLPQTTTSPPETTKPPSTTPSQDTTSLSVQTTATSPPTTTLPQTTTSPPETTKLPSTTPSQDTTSLSVQTTATSPPTTTLPKTTTSPPETTKPPSTTASPDTTASSVQPTVAGNWSNWGAWSSCSETCGNGTRNRTRLCNNPAPAHGGAACQGDANNTEACLVRYCPIAGNWSNWGAWSSCSETCGNGTRNRTRLCNNPAPAHGGAPCKGDPKSIGACFVRHCPTTSPPTTTLPQTTTSPTETTKPPSTTASPSTTSSSAPTTGINRTYIDIVFTLIASSDFSNETYALMETTAKQFIEEYEYVNYYVIAYVDGVLKLVNFSFGTNDSNAAAGRVRRAVGASEPLITVLEEALVAFQNSPLGESNNRKALVVMTDISSSADKNSLEKAVRPIEESGILVISVPIGAVNRTELLVISPNPLDVISVDKNLQPLQLANRIGERIIRKIPEIDVGFAISVSSIESTVIYAVMVNASSTINERYRDFRVRFNIIVYGTKKTTRLSEFFNTLLSHKDLITSVRNLENVSSLPLQEKLREAENLFRSTGRPSAKRVFVPITNAGNSSEIITGSNILRSHGIVLLSLNKNVDQHSSVTISHVDYLGTPSTTTDRRVVIAEEIIYQALRVVAIWSSWGAWSACSETCGNGTRSRTRLCINPAPAQGGAPCKGDTNNIEACFVRHCPELDVTFALSATSVKSQETFVLMRGTIISIINRYGIDRIHYSAIVFGSGIPTTSFDFASNIPDQDELIRKVIRLRKRDGRPDLEQALEEAKRIFELREVRPNARRIFVVIMDDATVSSREELSKVVHSLVKNSVFIVGVGIGSSVNATDLLIITREEQHILIVKTNKVDDELAEEIMRVIDPRVAPAGFSLWGKWSECSETCSSLNQTGTQRRNRTCINIKLGCEGSVNETRECNNQTCQAIGPVGSPVKLTGETGKGILIALWVMAGILTSLLFIFCCYYCCWHVCCGRGKKRNGITHSFLVEDEEGERWVSVPEELASGQNRGHENEVQEVVVEIGEEAGKPTGVIQFGIVADQSMENGVTADSVHPEPPLYSEEVAQVNSNASTLKMEPPEPRYANLNVVRKKTKNDQKGFFKIRRKLGSRLSNGRHESSPEWLSDPFENSTDNDSVTSFRCLDDFAIVDYEMFEGRRGSDQSADTVPDGYTRMKETNREFVNMNNAVDTNESPATQNDSNEFGKKEEPVAESGDQSMEVLEEWFNPTGKDAQPTQSSDRIDPVYSEVGTQIPTAEPINTEVESHSIYSVVGSKISS